MGNLLLKISPPLLRPWVTDFERCLNNPGRRQARLKAKIIHKLRRTSYGQSLGISKIDHWPQIPIVDYDQFQPWLTQQQQLPHQSITTPNKILFWEQTSGSTGPAKTIPYTAPLLGSFSAMFCLWAYDLLTHGSGLKTGKTYACISPKLGDNNSSLADTDYLLPPLRWLSQQFLVSVGNHFPDGETFRWQLALALLQTEDLEIISLWSPSFLTVQLDFIQQHQQSLLTALGDRLSEKRKRALGQNPIAWGELWPELKLISCWDRLFAERGAAELRTRLPGVWVQGKGLLATEAPVTMPWLKAEGFIPLIDQVVLEFLTESGELLDITQIQTGHVYELVISTLGGLYRYRLGDRLQVSHWYGQTPCLELLGRGDRVSDLVGEKLTEAWVAELFQQLGLAGRYHLSPVTDPEPHYQLWPTVAELTPLPTESSVLAEQLETALQRNHHYRQARQLGQLQSVQMTGDRPPDWWQTKRWGDRKDYCLQIPAGLNDSAKGRRKS